MELPKPTTAHKNLERLAGTWYGEETCHPSPWNPELSRSTGRSEHRVAHGGFHIICDYEQRKAGELSYVGHGVYSYDSTSGGAAGEYVCHWVDSMSPNGVVFRGQWSGDELILACQDPAAGHMRMRYATADLDAGRYGYRLESSPDGENWSTCMEATYERVAATVEAGGA